MNRVLVNAVADLFAALAMLGMVFTGLVLRFALPPGTHRTHTLWGISRHDWGEVHFWLAAAVVAILLLHVALHWQWVVSVAHRWVLRREAGGVSPRVRLWSGIITLLIVALAAVGFVFLSSAAVEVEPRDEPRRGLGVEQRDRGQGRDAGASNGDRQAAEAIEITGSMTLGEAAAAAGLSVDEARRRLGIPADTPDSRRMSRIGQDHDLRMSEARRRLQRAVE